MAKDKEVADAFHKEAQGYSPNPSDCPKS